MCFLGGFLFLMFFGFCNYYFYLFSLCFRWALDSVSGPAIYKDNQAARPAGRQEGSQSARQPGSQATSQTPRDFFKLFKFFFSACLPGCIATQPSRQPATMSSHQAAEAPSCLSVRLCPCLCLRLRLCLPRATVCDCLRFFATNEYPSVYKCGGATRL